LFGTSHGVDIASLCAATRTSHRQASTIDELREALRSGSRAGSPASPRGIRVVEVRTDRSRRRDLDRRLREDVSAALRS